MSDQPLPSFGVGLFGQRLGELCDDVMQGDLSQDGRRDGCLSHEDQDVDDLVMLDEEDPEQLKLKNFFLTTQLEDLKEKLASVRESSGSPFYSLYVKKEHALTRLQLEHHKLQSAYQNLKRQLPEEEKDVIHRLKGCINSAKQTNTGLRSEIREANLQVRVLEDANRCLSSELFNMHQDKAVMQREIDLKTQNIATMVEVTRRMRDDGLEDDAELARVKGRANDVIRKAHEKLQACFAEIARLKAENAALKGEPSGQAARP